MSMNTLGTLRYIYMVRHDGPCDRPRLGILACERAQVGLSEWGRVATRVVLT
jgi:hypothetical protein